MRKQLLLLAFASFSFASMSICKALPASGNINFGMNKSAALACSMSNVTISASGATTFCQGDSVMLNSSLTGGLYTYTWSMDGNVISGATSDNYFAKLAGNYSLEVDSSGCFVISNIITVMVNPLPTASITTSGATTFCQGDSVILNANTGLGLTYQWQLNGSNITAAIDSTYKVYAAGNYAIIVTNSNNCTDTSSATTVTVNALPTATISASGATNFCQGDSVILNANTGTGLTYQWQLNGSNITAATDSAYAANAAGNYSVIVGNSNNCSAVSNSITTTVNALPAATIIPGGVSNFCQGDSVLLNVNTGAGLTYQWQLNGSNITGAIDSTYTVYATGNYAVIVTNSNNCSAVSTASTINITALPSATITPAADTILCQGNSVALDANTGTGLTYQWQLNGNIIAGATNATYAANTAGSYAVIVSNSNNCSTNSLTTSIIVNPLPTVTASTTSQTPCAGNSIILTGGGADTYSWTGGAVDGVSFVPSATTTYTVTGTITATGCQNTATITVTVNALQSPAAVISASSSTTFCQGGTVTLKANTGTGYSYQWKLNGNNITGATGANFLANNSGAYKVTVTNSNGCYKTSNPTNVNVNPVPTASISASGPTTFCLGGNVTLKTNSDSTLTYVWKRNGTTISGAVDSTFLANSSGNYTVIVTNAGNCSATSGIIPVTVYSLPTASITITGSTTFCQGGSVTLKTSTGTGYTYQWQLNGSDISGATSYNYVATTSGTYNVIVSNPNNCSQTSSLTTVTVNPKPAALINTASPTTFCQGSSVMLTTNSDTTLLYQWKKNNVNITGGTDSLYTANTSGSYVVVVTNSNNCSSTSNPTTVTIIPLPTITVNASASSICEGDSVTLSGSGANTYTWSGGINDGLSFIPTGTTTYTVTGTDTVTGCQNNATKTITVKSLPIATLTAIGSTSFCQGNNVNLKANIGTNLTYQWQRNGNNISGAISSSYLASTSGIYNVVVSNSSSCYASSNSTAVTVNPLPSAPVSSNGLTVFCQGNSVLLKTNADSTLMYQWKLNGNSISGATDSTYTTGTGGNYSVTITDTNSCTATSGTIAITVKASPTAAITVIGSTTFCQGNTVTFKANVGTGLTYLWQQNGININGATGATYVANASGTYSVVITNTNNCSASSSPAIVTVNPLPVTPVISYADSIVTSSNNTGNQWYWDNTLISGATSQSYTCTQNGVYTVIVTDSNGCTAGSLPFSFNPEGINEASATNLLMIYPNPNNGTFNVIADQALVSEKLLLNVTNVIGEVIYKQLLNDQQITVDLNNMSKGIYFVQLISENRILVSKKIIIQ